MSLLPGIWNWKDHYRGSTFKAKPIIFNFDITGAIIICQIRAIQGSSIIHEWKTGVNITVIDLLTGDIEFDQIDEFKPAAGNYVYDVKIKFADGTSDPYLKGTQKVIQNITE